MPENYRTVRAKFNVGDLVVRKAFTASAIITSIQVSFHNIESYEAPTILYGVRFNDDVDLYHEVELISMKEILDFKQKEKMNEVETQPIESEALHYEDPNR